jgi:hypothetical protein
VAVGGRSLALSAAHQVTSIWPRCNRGDRATSTGHTNFVPSGEYRITRWSRKYLVSRNQSEEATHAILAPVPTWTQSGDGARRSNVVDTTSSLLGPAEG